VAEVLLDALASVPDDEVNRLDTALDEDVENVFEYRSVGGRKHRLRPVRGQRTEPRPLPRSEDDSCGDRHTRATVRW